MDWHERHRKPDGTSAIDPKRLHLNEVLHGNPEGPSASLKDFYAGGVKKPTQQAESPYLQIVISGSPEYFRPDDPKAAGTWDDDRMEAWRVRSEAWLKAEFGDDLVHVALHLDEDTPHMHALVAPTYEKKARKPGKQKRNETDAEFEERKRIAAEKPRIRTVGRASHETLSRRGSYQNLRERLAIAVADIGLEYGEDRTPDAPDGISTAEWVKRRGVQLKEEFAQLDQERAALRLQETALNAAENELQSREDALDQREREVSFKEARLRTVYQKVRDMIGDIADRLGVAPKLKAISDVIEEAGLDDSRKDRDPEDSLEMNP